MKKSSAKESNLWLVSPAEKDDMMPYFIIESNSEGERKPRIVKAGKGTNVYLTTKDDMGYEDKKRATWKIYETTVQKS